ncbi:isoleucine--tRNA ligase [Leptolyngbyaceae cyanobacterium CCMR0082]|uniref:Isoleucine--tRNA ligase n=1 Tax=Adonisia turfae CCMR0082 TaxID=2304604 RepID=A0A6M0SCR8_9CYAN|nr:isoleucine--tRNA ligase [Adonisia turfae]NEZ66290.1 isoleucine--tRNA ligase [Adonisia turfae CCMR0082]
MFRDVEKTPSFSSLEQTVIAFWKAHHIFQKSVDKPAPQGNFVFYEGPPTANGKPGVHHVISRAYKDLFVRYKTMQGHRVVRKGGWDTHGLPVELEVEKRLGFTKKSDIEAFGIAKFNELCKASVFERIQDWQAMTERIGYWLDLENAYVTYENTYIESCWWLMKSLWDRDLLFEDYRATWHCPRNNTSLSDHEVAQGYRDAEDPSVYPKFPVKTRQLIERGWLDEVHSQRSVYLLAWTTTPWTLAANVAIAINPNAIYGLFEASTQHGEETQKDFYLLAQDLADQVFGEGNYRTLKTFSGESLVGLDYTPILQGRVPDGEDLTNAFRVWGDDSVMIDEGTGVLHIAPAYGDLDLGRKYQLPMLFSVDLLGHVYPEVKLPAAPAGDGPYTGKFFKDADRLISQDLLAHNLLYRAATLTHTYPFNYRDNTPLINYAKKSWYLRTTAVKQQLLDNNNKINWHPDYIRAGRFGDWLRNNVDWALSRERYWGAPLPIWVSEDESEQICVGSVKELETLTGQDLSELDLHRPYIDDITFERNSKLFKRVPYTVDVWFESGAMPYAQWHYPFENQDVLAQSFPADYICEAIDQTRGWFYSLHALATLLTDPGDEQRSRGALTHLVENSPAFKNVIVLGHIVDENGEKMSKSKGNTVDPWTVLNAQGADALRWYLFSASPPETTKRFSQSLVDDTVQDFLMTLWNTYGFFVLYANLDAPDLIQVVPDRPDFDRWLVAKVHALTRAVTDQLDDYNPTQASRLIRDFVVNDLSNWYIRRNRRRFWKSENDRDKASAYKTLYEALVTVTKLMAPMAPFISEHLYQNLVLSVFPNEPESVHLAEWSPWEEEAIDAVLLQDMDILIRLVELGRAARSTAGVKLRQPLGELLVRVRTAAEMAGLKRFEAQLKAEINVKQVTYLELATDFVDYIVKPNLPLLGKRLGKQLPILIQTLTTLDSREIVHNIRNHVDTVIDLEGVLVHLEPEAFLIKAKSPDGYAAIEDQGYLAALNTHLTNELIQEGLMRQAIRHLQEARKNAGLAISDRIQLGLQTSGLVLDSLKAHRATVESEVLATEVRFDELVVADYSGAVTLHNTEMQYWIKRQTT